MATLGACERKDCTARERLRTAARGTIGDAMLK